MTQDQTQDPTPAPAPAREGYTVAKLPPLLMHDDYLLTPGNVDSYRVVVSFYTQEQGSGHAVVFAKASSARVAAQMAMVTMFGYLRSTGHTLNKNHVTPMAAFKGVDEADWDWNDEVKTDDCAKWDTEMGLNELIAAENEGEGDD
jgi:hypothetical protein